MSSQSDGHGEPVTVPPPAEARSGAAGAPAGGEPPEDGARPEAHTPSGQEGSEVACRLAEIAARVEESNRLGLERERIIDRLHEENQRLKAGEIQQIVTPIFRDLVRLFDDLSGSVLEYRSSSEPKLLDVARDLACFRDVVSDILYRHGIERYEVDPGGAFDAKTHRVIRVAATSDPALDRTVARVVRPGFRSEARVLRAAEVEVYRHTPRRD